MQKIAVILAWLVAACPVFAATYDANNVTTLQWICNGGCPDPADSNYARAAKGDTINVRAGTYTLTASALSIREGVTIQRLAGESNYPLIIAKGAGTYCFESFAGEANGTLARTTIKDLELQDGNMAIHIIDHELVTIDGCTIHDNVGLDNVLVGFTVRPTNVTISNCRIYNSGDDNIGINGIGTGSANSLASSLTVTGSTVFQAGTGVSAQNITNHLGIPMTIRNSTCYNSGGGNIEGDGNSPTYVYNTTCRGPGARSNRIKLNISDAVVVSGCLLYGDPNFGGADQADANLHGNGGISIFHSATTDANVFDTTITCGQIRSRTTAALKLQRVMIDRRQQTYFSRLGAVCLANAGGESFGVFTMENCLVTNNTGEAGVSQSQTGTSTALRNCTFNDCNVAIKPYNNLPREYRNCITTALTPAFQRQGTGGTWSGGYNTFGATKGAQYNDGAGFMTGDANAVPAVDATFKPTKSGNVYRNGTTYTGISPLDMYGKKRKIATPSRGAVDVPLAGGGMMTMGCGG